MRLGDIETAAAGLADEIHRCQGCRDGGKAGQVEGGVVCVLTQQHSFRLHGRCHLAATREAPLQPGPGGDLRLQGLPQGRWARRHWHSPPQAAPKLEGCTPPLPHDRQTTPFPNCCPSLGKDGSTRSEAIHHLSCTQPPRSRSSVMHAAKWQSGASPRTTCPK